MGVEPSLASQVFDYMSSLQKDGRLLLRHLIRRSDSGLPELAPVGTAIDGTPSDVMFAETSTILADPFKIAELVTGVDVLSRRVAPANVRSIRLTSAYLGMKVELDEPPLGVKQEARRIYYCMLILGLLAGALFVVTVVLLAYADQGRRLLQQVDGLRHSDRDLFAALSIVPDTEFILMPPRPQAAARKPGQPAPAASAAGPTVKSAPFCHPAKEMPPGSAPTPDNPWLQANSAKTIDLCRQQDDLSVRFRLTYAELADWSCLPVDALHQFYIFSTPPSDLAKRCGPQPGGLSAADLQAWMSHDARVSAAYAVLSGFVLPMLLGFLGGCAYAFRRLDKKLATWTLEPQDGKHAVVRVCLAAMLGGLVGVVWSPDQSVSLGGFTLSLVALAFFVGFSVEVVFQLLQTVIEAVASSLRTPPVPVSAPAPISEAQIRRIAKDAAESAGSARGTDLTAAPA